MNLQPCSLNGIEFDALINETDSFTSEVPSYAVESGFDVSDNIAVKPLSIEITAYVTNTPVTWFSKHGNRSVEGVVAEIESLYFSKALVTLRTGSDIYENMAIETLTVPKDETNKRSREIKITLRQINIVSAQTTTIPASYIRGGTTGANAGTASTSGTATGKKEEKTESGGKASILYSLINN